MKTPDPYEQLWKLMQRQGVSPGVVSQLKKIAGRWAGERRH